MNINDILSPQTRSRVYLALGIVGLVLGAAGAGIGAFAASGFTAPLIVGAALSAVNAVYAFVAGAFGFVAKANTPSGPNAIQISSEDFEDIAYIEEVADALPEATVDGIVEDTGPVG